MCQRLKAVKREKPQKPTHTHTHLTNSCAVFSHKKFFLSASILLPIFSSVFALSLSSADAAEKRARSTFSASVAQSHALTMAPVQEPDADVARAAQQSNSVLPISGSAIAKTNTTNDAKAEAEQESLQQAELDRKTTQIAVLKEDIKLIDADLASCKKKKTGWGVAMGIGAAATVGLGVNAIVNKSKISDKREELDTKTKIKGTAL